MERGRAKPIKTVPFVIKILDLEGEDLDIQPLIVKIDPGSKGTGISLVRESIDENGGIAVAVIWLMELMHRGLQIKKKMDQRRGYRRRRRSKNLRYRAMRFNNRAGLRRKGWLAPSINHRVESVVNWATKLLKWAPISRIAMELFRFDTQKMDKPEISCVEYQQGEMAGYELKEYLLEKWGRKCAYCGAKNVPLQVEHIQPKAKGGTNKASNLTLACENCNAKKGSQDLAVFLSNKPELAKSILSKSKAPLKDAAAVNPTRWALWNTLKDIGLPMSAGSGGQTKYNRVRLGVPKTHALDAVCVGGVDQAQKWKRPTMIVTCRGRGSYQRTGVNASGFPRGYIMRTKTVFGFELGIWLRPMS
jgi:5-methylcytosine-specific restriction endonuclease McrA